MFFKQYLLTIEHHFFSKEREMKEKLLKAYQEKVEEIISALIELQWEDCNFKIEDSFCVREILQLDKERVVICRSFQPIETRGLPYGCNTLINALSVLNLKTEKEVEIHWYYSNQWDAYSKMFKSNRDWFRYCLETGKTWK